ncbi:Gfo/Idh/MocA family protein [Luteococcus sp. Sow4_B9]|uniref:Gfo/Idh/MocA family protein n=1 Tax=Luteococcus sp. Sow4_B9 TaxID=3438792 RepID=UPI003F9B0390
MTRELGIGVVSLGWMGRLHAAAYAALPMRYPELGVRPRLVVCADPVESNQQAAVEQYGFERAVADYHEVIDDPAVEAVSICAPNFLHHEIAMAAIKTGKPFWIEKPMGVSAQQSREIAEGAQQAGLVTAVGFNYRHEPAVERMRELVRTGRLGRVTNVRVWLIADYASAPDGPLTWRYSREKAGAGVVGDLMSHGVDLAQWVTGQRVTSVSGLTDTFITERPIPLTTGVGHAKVELSDESGPVENEDYVAVLATFENGIVGTFESSRVAVGPRAEYVVEIYGTEGSARWSFTHPQDLQLLIRGEGPATGYTTAMTGMEDGDFARFQPGPGQTMSFDDLKVIEASQFIESVLSGQQHAPSAGDAWLAAAADEAIVESATAKRWIDVPTVAVPTTFAFPKG